MKSPLSKRVNSIKDSPTLAVDSKAKAMKASGVDVIGFGAGEPDFETPDHIRKAAIDAINAGFTRYTPAAGTDELRDAVRRKFKRDQCLEYERSQTIISVGGKHALFNLFQAALNPGDEIIIPAPYWVSYPDMAILAGAKPVIVETSEKSGFVAKPAAIEKAITNKTKMLVICSPSNPTGGAYEPKDLEKIAALAKKHDILIVSDEIYEKMVYGDYKFSSIAQVSKDAYERTIVVNGVSKTYAMTGWRIGYTAGTKEIVGAMAKIQSQSTSNPTSIAQKAAVAALDGDQSCVATMVKAFDERRKYIVARLNSMKSVTCFDPKGAFYVLPNLKAYLKKSYTDKKTGEKKKIANDMDLAEYFLSQSLVALVPGSAFGAPGYMRLSYATSMDNIRKGLDRIEAALGDLA